MAFHKSLTEIHRMNNFVFADTPARWAGTGYTIVEADIGKAARQTDDGSLWVLKNHSPILWHPFCSGNHRAIFHDDFWGEYLLSLWVDTVSGTGSSVVLRSTAGGEVRLRAGAELAASAEIDFGSNEQIELALNPEFTARLSADEITDALQIAGMEENAGGNEGIFIRRTGTGNWFAVCVAGGTETTVDMGLHSTDFFEIRIQATPTEVKFFYDEVLKATITTNITTEDLEPIFYIENEAAIENKDLKVDFVSLNMDRS